LIEKNKRHKIFELFFINATEQSGLFLHKMALFALDLRPERDCFPPLIQSEADKTKACVRKKSKQTAGEQPGLGANMAFFLNVEGQCLEECTRMVVSMVKGYKICN
jgi:hypothetical protein